MRRYVHALLVGSILLLPVGIRADDEHKEQERHRAREQRYYDREGHDWHEWNEHENRAYRHWLQEQHRDYRDWERANRREQQQYWRWRHSHRGDFDDVR